MSSILEIIASQPGLVHLEAATVNQIDNAQKELSLRFSKEYCDYLSKYGVASFELHEMTGICASDRLNVVSITKRKKKENAEIPNGWYVVEDLDIDDVIIWQDEQGMVYQTIGGKNMQKIANSLAEYLLTDTEDKA